MFRWVSDFLDRNGPSFMLCTFIACICGIIVVSCIEDTQRAEREDRAFLACDDVPLNEFEGCMSKERLRPRS